jgi:RNA polymerase sigma factor (TIGR02999 family)
MAEPQITQLLDAARSGDADATEALFNAVYQELKGLARFNRRRWRGQRTMNTTALIHEVFIKMARGAEPNFSNRTHFFATASKAMRQVLVNYAKQQQAIKRGGDALRVTLDDSVFATQASADELLHIHQLLTDLAEEHPRRCQIVECRVFGGMSVEETADALGISTATVKRDWRLATAKIYEDLQTQNDSAAVHDP